MPENVKASVKKAVVEDKELPDAVETAIKRTLEKKEEEEKREAAPLSSSAENVVSQCGSPRIKSGK